MTISLAEAAAVLESRGPRPSGARAHRPSVERRGDARLTDATHDSRQVRPGSLFCAVVGSEADGHDFAQAAADAGASAFLVERWLDLDRPQLRVPCVREAMGPVAAAIHDDPSQTLTTVGITGTNGKTTVTYLLEAAFGAGGVGTGVIGTVSPRVHGSPLRSSAGDRTAGAGRTTPEATDLQRLLRTMWQRGVDAVAMEVSSHGLDQQRIDGTTFDVVVFTNLSQDHLDYHGSLEEYYRAKARLFTPAFADRAVICVDDEWGRRLAHEAGIPVTTYGVSSEAQARITEVRSDAAGTSCRLTEPDGDDVVLETRLLGEHNALNAAGAYLAAVAAGFDTDAVAAGIAACEGVPGRFEPVDAGQPFAVVVDYAHTPDALDQAVSAAARLRGTTGRLHVVVGCGGDRDRDKRPAMGRIAAGADHAVLTSDNPRSEDPRTILDEVVAGAREVEDADITVEIDRRTAIERAVAAADEGDVVLIAGKGHETGQEIGDRTLPFDDREVARSALERRSASPRPDVPSARDTATTSDTPDPGAAGGRA